MRKCPNCKENTISYWKLIAGNAWENIECSNCKNTVKISLKWNVIIGIPLFIAGWLIISVYNAGHRNEFIFGASILTIILYSLIRSFIAPLIIKDRDEKK